MEQSAPGTANTERGSQTTGHDSPEPPAWLAAQMKDPWNGEEARDLWNGIQQARQEAAAYREVFAKPEDARALKELYPGGVSEARTAAERAKFLDDIDRAYFGTAGGSAEQISAARAQLAQTLLREDPAAFREMVFTGLRALEEAEKGSAGAASSSSLPRLAQLLASSRNDTPSSAGAALGSPAPNVAPPGARPDEVGRALPSPASVVGARHASSVLEARPAPQLGNASATEAHMAAYAAFEKAANEDLERSVGAAIERTIQQTLPNISTTDRGSVVGAQRAAPLQARLAAAVRQDVESALKDDRQLGEQIAQILSARRFDNETRAQVVRLINERARQLVPGAAKRVINDWTHATLAAHRAKGERAEGAAARREVAPASTQSSEANRSAQRADSRRVDSLAVNKPIDYRRLSDEQILDL